MQVDKTSQLIAQVDQLYKQSLNALVATLAVMAFVTYQISGNVPHTQLWIWVSVIVLINIYLTIWILRIRKTGVHQNNVRLYLYTYQIEAILHGGSWGMLPFLLLNNPDPESQLFAYFVVCGMAAGAIATTAMIYRIYLSFMLPMLLPIIIWQGIGFGPQMFDSGAFGLLLIFFIAMLALSHAHYDSVIKTIRLVQQNEDLVNDLRQAVERSEAANQAKTEFLSNTSHELRTPLNAIMGFSSLLMKFSLDDLPQKAKEYVRNIHQAGSHLSDLINQVLDIAKIETNKAPVELRAVDIRSMLRETMKLMRPLAVQHQVHLKDDSVEIETDASWVTADPLRLRQVLINLISNAIKYNREQGDVSIRCMLHDGFVRIEIEDNGIGIAPDKHEEIFSAFSRVHHDLKIEGTGIGLTVSKKNLELMGSNIHMSSEPGIGSKFWFDLPRAETPSESLPGIDLPGFDTEAIYDIKVLYVEDNPLGMRLMQEVMSQVQGITLFCAETGEQGYQMALDTLPDVILLDINLPDISGMEVMQRLRELPGMQLVPMVALSASALTDDVELGLKAGFTEYLKKPCPPDEIVERVIELASIKPVKAAQ
ncbi:MAG: response regulator [Gammaproteobacteria bacterium]|nr:response regulator [Gammaproteobacteria bacterium]